MAPAVPGQPRILLITSVLPWPLHRNGGAQRTDLLRRSIEEEGFAVDTLALMPRPGPVAPSEPELRRHGVVAAFPVEVSLALRPRPRYVPSGFDSVWSLAHVRRVWKHRYEAVPAVSEWIRAREADYAAVYVRYLQTALLAGLDHRNPAADPRVWVDVDDVDWLTLQSRFSAQPWPGVVGRLGMFLALRTVKTRCTRALPAFNGFFVTSDTDARELRGLGHKPLLLPNIPYPDNADSDDVAPVPPAPSESQTILFVGDLEFAPNVTGLAWFLKECWPEVRRAVPNAILRIVGRGLSPRQEKEWSAAPGVEVVGFAQDLRSEYARSVCTISPTSWGGGTKIKVVESAAMGRACVATPHAIRGFEYLANGPAPALVVAGDAAQFAAGLVRLLADRVARRRMGDSGRVLAAMRSGFAGFRKVVAESLQGIEDRKTVAL